MIPIYFNSPVNFNFPGNQERKGVQLQNNIYMSKWAKMLKVKTFEKSIELVFFKSILFTLIVGMVAAILLDLYLKICSALVLSNILILAILVGVYFLLNRIYFANLAVIMTLSIDLILIYRGVFLSHLFTINIIAIMTLGITASLTTRASKTRDLVHLIIFISLLMIIFSSNVVRPAISFHSMVEFVRQIIPYIMFFFVITRSTAILKDKYKEHEKNLTELNKVLDQMNKKIHAQNCKLQHNHDKLERLVQFKTAGIEKKNQQLEQLSYANAHQVRGPLARILGLLNLIDIDPQDRDSYLKKIKLEARAMDAIVRSVGETIQSHINNDKVESAG